MFIWIGAQSVELTLYGMNLKFVPSASNGIFKNPLAPKSVYKGLIGHPAPSTFHQTSESITMEFFSSALEKYTVALLSKISEDYSLPLDELVAKYHTTPLKKAKVERKPRTPKDPNAPPKPAKVAKEDRPICPSLTGKKTPCKNRCLPGSDKCHLHCVTLPTGEPKPPRAPRVPKASDPSKPEKVTKKSAKKSKVQPSHNHAPLVAPDAPCQLCDSHGDAMNPKAPSVQFESQSLQDRLRAIIQSESEAESEPESEAEAEPEPEPEVPKTPKKSKKAKSPEPEPEPQTPKKSIKKPDPEPVAPPAPIKVPKSASIEERMALILSEEPEEEEEEEEPESPGGVRHRLLMAAKGLPVKYDEEEELDEDEIEDPDDAEMTEDEFEEEELLE